MKYGYGTDGNGTDALATKIVWSERRATERPEANHDGDAFIHVLRCTTMDNMKTRMQGRQLMWAL